jgi:hypothetical protein
LHLPFRQGSLCGCQMSRFHTSLTGIFY